MLKSLVGYLIRQQDKATGESADFLRDIYGAAPGGFWRFALFMPMNLYRPILPVNAAAAVRIAAVHAEDCGPCLQTVVTLSLKAGAEPHILHAAVAGDPHLMDEETRTAFEFARLVVARDMQAEDLRADVERLWGKKGLSEIALAIASTRVFPTIKRTMGYGQACQRVVIDGETAEAALRETAVA